MLKFLYLPSVSPYIFYSTEVKITFKSMRALRKIFPSFPVSSCNMSVSSFRGHIPVFHLEHILSIPRFRLCISQRIPNCTPFCLSLCNVRPLNYMHYVLFEKAIILPNHYWSANETFFVFTVPLIFAVCRCVPLTQQRIRDIKRPPFDPENIHTHARLHVFHRPI
jgi:hypothetical protein